MKNIKNYNKLELTTANGFNFGVLPSGLISHISVDEVMINLKPATLWSRLASNLYLRIIEGSGSTQTISYQAMMGPTSDSRFEIRDNSFVVQGKWKGLHYDILLYMHDSADAWTWQIDIRNGTASEVLIDVVHVQDVGLHCLPTGSVNEYYVSQYIDRRVFNDPHYGSVVCCRQNATNNKGRNPCLLISSSSGAASASVDGSQLFGSSTDEHEILPGLLTLKLGGECAGENSVVALQAKPVFLSSQNSTTINFCGYYLPHLPGASSEKILEDLRETVLSFQTERKKTLTAPHFSPQKNMFNHCNFLAVEDLDSSEVDTYFASEKRYCEKEGESLLSFFYGNAKHVVMRKKELRCDRPHGHIIQTHHRFSPDDNIMSSTAYMKGVFNSHLCQANTNFCRLLSINTSHFNLETYTGQRIFVTIEGKPYLLGMPSAFEMGLNSCRWIYKTTHHCFEVRTWASQDDSQGAGPQIFCDFRVVKGAPVTVAVSHHLDATNTWQLAKHEESHEVILRPSKSSRIAEKFPEARYKISGDSDGRQLSIEFLDNIEVLASKHTSAEANTKESFLYISAEDTEYLCTAFTGELLAPATSRSQSLDKRAMNENWKTTSLQAYTAWKTLSSHIEIDKGECETLGAIQEILPWFGSNAMVHFLSPHGLEQFEGAAWGTRDVNQGPLELLIANGQFSAAKKLLSLVWSHQNSAGDWPQWWMYDRFRSIRADSAHGDIGYWCVIGVCQYIEASQDFTFLDEIIPYFEELDGAAEPRQSVSQHIDNAIEKLASEVIPGTRLAKFGGGDWNDSMQPTNSDLSQRMVSSWTVALSYQAFSAYQKVCALTGRDAMHQRLEKLCSEIKRDFNSHLIRDNIIAGHIIFNEGGRVEHLLHPSDTQTGIRYRLLPMMRSVISGIFSAEQAQSHRSIIEKHLKGPDGARLMDRPPKYRGGVQHLFKRAESSPYFGREIGIMYMHAHLRYIEMLAKLGCADDMHKALRQVIAISYDKVVEPGSKRQANCYFSSSDAVFPNRYSADSDYDKLLDGTVQLKSGWRIYSSGPGIFISLIITRLLGLRRSWGNLILDPVIPRHLDGLSMSLKYESKTIRFEFFTSKASFGPKKIIANGQEISFEREENPYRLGGARVPQDLLMKCMDEEQNLIQIYF